LSAEGPVEAELTPPGETDVGVGLDEDLKVEQVQYSRILKSQDPFQYDDVG
jgi:hypothetical protein